MKISKPQKQHRTLQKIVGDWTYETEMVMQAGSPPLKFSGTESVRALGGLWIVAEGQGEMPGGGMATSVMTVGFDDAKKRFVGTWIGSVMSHMWVYDGTLNPAGKVLTLNTVGPSMLAKGKSAKYKDVIEFKNKNHRVLTSHMQGKGGKWTCFMTAHYRRVK